MYIYIKKNIATNQGVLEKGLYAVSKEDFEDCNYMSQVTLTKCKRDGVLVKIKSIYDNERLVTVNTYPSKYILSYLLSESVGLAVKFDKKEDIVTSSKDYGLTPMVVYPNTPSFKNVVVYQKYGGSILPSIKNMVHIHYVKPVEYKGDIYLKVVRMSRSHFTCGIMYLTLVNTTFGSLPEITGSSKEIEAISKLMFENLFSDLIKASKATCLLFSTNVQSFNDEYFKKHYKMSLNKDNTTTENYSYNDNSNNRIVTVCVNKK